MPDTDALFAAALRAADNAYAPYSHFRVGAALLCGDGSVVTGANVENRSFGLTLCAERSAISTALSSGKRDFTAIVIATPDSGYPVSPCGACRQVLTEFMASGAPVEFGNSTASRISTTVGQLFPHDALHELSHTRAGTE